MSAGRRFAGDTAEHQLTIRHDDGLYRHLTCAKPGTGVYGFHIVTYPGHLVIGGDMGTYVFAREADMFGWFGNGTTINPGYWGEKLQAIEKGSPIKRYSANLFRQWVLQNFWETREDYSEAVAASIWHAICESILDDHSTHYEAEEAMRTLDGFYGPAGFEYTDAWEAAEAWREYDFHFLWCCHAILWAIRAYHQQKEAAAELAKTGLSDLTAANGAAAVADLLRGEPEPERKAREAREAAAASIATPRRLRNP